MIRKRELGGQLLIVDRELEWVLFRESGRELKLGEEWWIVGREPE